MPSILVVEQEPRYVERIQSALGAEGWSVRLVPSVDQALQSAAAERPDLVVAGTDLPGFEVLVFSFSRRAGGPGVLGLEPEGGGGLDGADARLARPFNDQQLVLAARQALLAPRRAAAASAVTPEQKLTSLDIFGDVLAEVEGNQPARPAATPPSPVATVARPAPPPVGEDDVQRRLEKTLSGMLTPEPRPRPAAPPAAAPVAAPVAPVAAPRRAEPAGDTAASAAASNTANHVDALLSKTLSNLDLGKTKTGVRPAPPAAAPPPPAPARPMAAAPAAPAAEGTGARKGRAVGDFDFAELEELARTSSQPAAAPAAAPAPSAAAASPVRPAPPPAAPRTAPPPEPLPFPLPAPAIPVPTGASVAPAAANPAATQRIPVFAAEEAGELSGDQAGERFGQYTLLERIAVGGMAEVWKARMRGVEGFQKTVAIKRILSHMTDNAEFVGMFIDEAKLAAQLTHPNIVHIYDLGKIGRDYYIAMEYVDGKDLRSLLNAGRRKGTPLPLSLSLLIAARVASALDYAHRKRDFEDRELGLVHRDVSPQNVLLTGEGDVKLCDFGIAKAVSKVGQTQMGALKGKLQYMSPEQAWGRPVDGRSDLFSLGTVLFEMVTGERLFTGDSEMSVLEAVRQGRTRLPSQVDPSVPRAVDEIVARALAIDPQDRFQNAGEMKQRLEAALASLFPSTGLADLGAYIQRVLDPDTPEMPRAVERHEPVVSQVVQVAPVVPPPVPAAPAVPALPQAFPPEPAVAASPAPAAPYAYPSVSEEPVEAVAAVAPLGTVTVEEEGGRKSRTLLYAAIAALIVIAILTYFLMNRRKGGAPPPPPTAAAAAPAQTVAPAANPAPPVAIPAAQTPPAPAGAKVDLKAMMDQQLAAKESELRRKNEAKLKDLEKQVAAAKATGQPVPAPAASATSAAVSEPASMPKPAPAETPPAAPPIPQPEPAKVEEKAPPPAPEPKREPAPVPHVKAGELVAAGPGVAPPQLVSFPKPEYPPMARTLRVEGVAVVSVLVDENGQVQDVRMAEPIKQKAGLNEAALAAARSAHYKPATKDGVPVKMWTRLRIPFKL
jgi:TonB family protein